MKISHRSTRRAGRARLHLQTAYGAVEITGPMSGTLWASTDAKDTDWIVMLLDGSGRSADGYRLSCARFRGIPTRSDADAGTVEQHHDPVVSLASSTPRACPTSGP